MRFAVGLGSLAVIIGGCLAVVDPTPSTTPSPSPTVTPWPIPDAWDPLLERPLEVPVLGLRDPCPVTTVETAVEGIRAALGDGPIYPALGGSGGILELQERNAFEGRSWLAQKTLWLSDDRYRGIAVVRGARLDAAGTLRFQTGGDILRSELRLTLDSWVFGGNPPPGWRQWNSYTVFSDPGCYAYQVDGDSFTTVIVVEVRGPDA